MNKRTYFLLAFASILVILTVINLIYLKVSISFIQSSKKFKGADSELANNIIQNLDQGEIIGLRRIRDDDRGKVHTEIIDEKAEENKKTHSEVVNEPFNASADTHEGKKPHDNIELHKKHEKKHEKYDHEHEYRHGSKSEHEQAKNEEQKKTPEKDSNMTVNVNNSHVGDENKPVVVVNNATVNNNTTDVQTNITEADHVEEEKSIPSPTVNVTVPQQPLIPNQDDISKDKPTDQVVANDKPIDPVLANDKPIDPVVVNDKPTDQVVANDKPIDPVVANNKPIDPIVVNDKPIDPVVVNDKPIGSVVADNKPIDKVVSNDEPIDPLVANDKFIDPVAINDKFIDPVVADNKPTDSVVADDKPIDPVVADNKPTIFVSDVDAAPLNTNDVKTIDPLPNIKPESPTIGKTNLEALSLQSVDTSVRNTENWDDEEFHRRDNEYHKNINNKKHHKLQTDDNMLGGPSDNPLSHSEILSELKMMEKNTDDVVKLSELNQDTVLEVKQDSVSATVSSNVDDTESVNNSERNKVIDKFTSSVIVSDKVIKEINRGNLKVIILMISVFAVLATVLVLYERYHSEKKKKDFDDYNYLYEGYQLYRGEDVILSDGFTYEYKAIRDV